MPTESHSTYQMMRSDVYPRNQIFLCDILAIEEFVKIDYRMAWQIHVPHATWRRLGVFATGNGEIVSCPVSIFEQAFWANDRL